MTDKPWWIWKGAAIRVSGRLAEFDCMDARGRMLVLWPTMSGVFEVTPIENPAVMLRPEGATHVCISKHGWVSYGYAENDDDLDWEPFVEIGYRWSDCPDHLKGHIWPLPRRET